MHFYLQNKNIQFFSEEYKIKWWKILKHRKNEDQITSKTFAFNLMKAVIKIQFFHHNKKIVSWLFIRAKNPMMKILKQMISLLLLSLIGEVMKSSLVADALQTQHMQNSVVSCEDGKRKLLCLPQEYSKFDLPHRNDFNEIEIGKYDQPSNIEFKTIASF